MTDFTKADLTDADRAMLDYAVKLTLRHAEISKADIEALRAVDFADDAITHIAQVVGLFNYYNRIAEGLGVDDEPHW